MSLIYSQQTVSTNHSVFSRDKQVIQSKLTHNSWVCPCRFLTSTLDLLAPPICRWDKRTPAATCICTAFLVFNSPQLTVSIVTGWEELKTEKDIQDIRCPSLSLPPWLLFSRCHEVDDVWAEMSL